MSPSFSVILSGWSCFDLFSITPNGVYTAGWLPKSLPAGTTLGCNIVDRTPSPVIEGSTGG